MKKFFLLLIFLLIIPYSSAWWWETHEAIAELAFRNLPSEVQNKLNLEFVKEGSNIPDNVFKDNYKHHYPPSFRLAKAWLEFSRREFEAGHFDNASYALGIATHYISDSFAAPHSAKNADYDLHMNFEKQAQYYAPKAVCSTKDFDLESSLKTASEIGEQDWDEWLKNNDKKIAQREVDGAAETVLSAAIQTFGAKCEETNTNLALGFGVALAILAGIIIFLRRRAP
ncbi:zinc dependent phospholipase C family protein [Candidatus Woesearchaeota archaeon]|nr:zinc dependent phospholipase C family protein [Candidatus Woesearchaeota archaeon]